jgi:hypothetical protein
MRNFNYTWPHVAVNSSDVTLGVQGSMQEAGAGGWSGAACSATLPRVASSAASATCAHWKASARGSNAAIKYLFTETRRSRAGAASKASQNANVSRKVEAEVTKGLLRKVFCQRLSQQSQANTARPGDQGPVGACMGR